jgi:hypothetical protein
MANEPDWLIDFDITVEDLHRIEEWFNEKKKGVALEEITRRIIRGRLQYGRDESPSVLPDWIQDKHVLSWDEEDKWCLGCQVLVARKIQGKVTPFFGVITDISETLFYIKIDDEIVKYGREMPGSERTKIYYIEIKKSIWERERQLSDQSLATTIDERVEVMLLKKGAEIASKIQSALEKDKRFSLMNQHWFLRVWIHEIPQSTILLVHKQIIKTTKTATLSQLKELIHGLPEGEVGELSLLEALSKAPDLFQPSEDGWLVVTLPPPLPENAVGKYYVYDPETYEILLNPGSRLTKKVANRLMELGLYADVVEAKVDY